MTMRAVFVPFSALVLAGAACCSVPTYQPTFWNDGGQVQYNNNCYNYGNNKRTDTFAQPGLATGHGISAQVTCDEVRANAVADGLVLSSTGASCGNKDKLALVAGWVGPWRDYHWYRQDVDGRWTHKPGGTWATNVDNSGHVITSPETADRAGYGEFCGYLCSCSSSTEGQGHEKIQ